MSAAASLSASASASASGGVSEGVVKHIKEIFPQHSDATITTTLLQCNSDINACITRLLTAANDDVASGDEPFTNKSLAIDFLSSPQFHVVKDDTQRYSIGYEYSVIFHRTEEQGLDINVKAIGQRILVNELYTNKVTGLPGLSAQAGILPGDVFVGIDYEYFNVGCALPDVTRITRAAGKVITLQFFRFYDNAWIIDALALARQGENLSDVNSEEELKKMHEKSVNEESKFDMLYHKYNCAVNNYRDLYNFRQQLLTVYGIRVNDQKIHHCAFLLREQELLRESDIDLFTDSMGRLLSRCLQWDSGSICERSRISDVLLTMLSSGMLPAQATVHHSDGNYHGYTLNSLRFLPPTPDVSYLQYQLPVQFNVSNNLSLSTRSRSVRPDDRRSSTGTTASRRGSTGMTTRFTQRSLSQQAIDAASNKGNNNQLDHPSNASIRLLWKKAITLNTQHLRPALGIRITNINVVDNSHFEYKIWVNDIDTGLEWYVYRRFSEFYNFRETLVSIWPLFSRIYFPPRRLSLTSSAKVANERLPVLEHFLRTVYSIVSVQPLIHISTRAIYSALQDMLDVTFRRDGIQATIQQNKDLFLNSQRVMESEQAEEDESLASSRAMSSESGQGGIISRNNSTADSIPVETSGSPRVTWRRNGNVTKSNSAPSTPMQEEVRAVPEHLEETIMSTSGDSLSKLGVLMEAVTTSPSRPRRHSLFDDEDVDGIEERLSSLVPLPPPPTGVIDKMNPEEVEIEREPDFVSLRSPSGVSPLGGGRKRISSLSRTHLPKFEKLPSFDILDHPQGDREGEVVECAVGSDDGRDRSVTNTSSLGDRPNLSSLSNIDSTVHPPSYSRVLSKRLEVFVHLVLQVPTFRHIIDPFVKKFRNKILDWELDRTFIMTEELVYDRLKFIAEFIDNLQEVLLEGLSADMDSICTYILSQYCDSQAARDGLSNADKDISKSYRSKTTSLSNVKLFSIRKLEEHAIDRTTNRGRSYSVNDGHMSNIVIPGVDLDAMYRKVIRRQVESEIYLPSRDALDTMMSRQFGIVDKELERKCNILRNKPQLFFGISVEHMSPSSWESAISAFGRISAVYTLPVDKLDALVVAAKMIPELFEKEHCVVEDSTDGTSDQKQKSLGADDMLPIFIYCIVMSNIPFTNMQSLVHELDFVCDTQSRYSEVGYFVTTFQASIQHILHMDEVRGETVENA